MQRPLVPRELIWLCETGALALYAGILFRLSMIFFMHHSWLLDTQIAGACLLLALLNFCGSAVPRAFGDPLMYLLGALLWICALSMIPRYLWPTTQLSNSLLVAAAVMLGLAFAFRFARQQRWFSRMRGKGWQWILDWAGEQPFYARRLAQKALRAIGYREEEQEA
jgi:hypothetical protein